MDKKERAKQIREEINSRLPRDFIIYQRDKSGKPACPICGSGTGKNGTSAYHENYKDSGRHYCFSGGCELGDKGEDTLGLLRLIWTDCETEADIFRKAGYSLDDDIRPAPAKKQTPPKEERPPMEKPVYDFTADYKTFHEALKASEEAKQYLFSRHISEKAIEHFYLGYASEWINEASAYKGKSKRIIIPRSKGSYLARAIDPNNTASKLNGGERTAIFNHKALKNTSDPLPIIVTEGELDAISIYQALGNYEQVIALCSANQWKHTAEAIKEINPTAVYVLALDNDEAGRTAQSKLHEDLTRAGVLSYSADTSELYGESKDANEAYIKDPERLSSKLYEACSEADSIKEQRRQEQQAERDRAGGPGMVKAFLEKVRTEAYKPISTGTKEIDEILSGGFTRQTLCILSSFPGAGKTTLTSQLFETMAEKGIADILYINLEMSREQMLARSLARMSAREGRVKLTSGEILRGYSWTEQQEIVIADIAKRYSEKIARHFIYNPGENSPKLTDIINKMNEEAIRLKAEGRPAPIVIIDYLQLIQGEAREDATAVIKEAVQKLKDYAIKNDTIVFLISAQNRADNKTGKAEMTSGRDTSAIEYSADIMLGLTYEAIDHDKDLDEINSLKDQAYSEGKPLPDIAKYFSLKVVKNRGQRDRLKAILFFDGEHSLFLPATLEDYKRAEGSY